MWKTWVVKITICWEYVGGGGVAKGKRKWRLEISWKTLDGDSDVEKSTWACEGYSCCDEPRTCCLSRSAGKRTNYNSVLFCFKSPLQQHHHHCCHAFYRLSCSLYVGVSPLRKVMKCYIYKSDNIDMFSFCGKREIAQLSWLKVYFPKSEDWTIQFLW